MFHTLKSGSANTFPRNDISWYTQSWENLQLSFIRVIRRVRKRTQGGEVGQALTSERPSLMTPFQDCWIKYFLPTLVLPDCLISCTIINITLTRLCVQCVRHNRWTQKWWTHWTQANGKRGGLRASSPSIPSRMSGTCWRGGRVVWVPTLWQNSWILCLKFLGALQNYLWSFKATGIPFWARWKDPSLPTCLN